MPARSRWTLVATILGSSMTFIDATVVNVALPALQADLHATITDVQWVIEAYALFLGALILVGGSLGDQFGRKRVFLVGVAFFTAASIALRSRDLHAALIVGRALQGIGAAFLVPGSLAIISATFDDAERGRAIGTWSGFSAITTAIGPVIGGWLDRTRQLARRVLPQRAARGRSSRAVAAVHGRKPRSVADGARSTGRAPRLAVLGLGGVVFGLLEWPPLGAGIPLVLGALALGVAVARAARGRRASCSRTRCCRSRSSGRAPSRSRTCSRCFCTRALASSCSLVPLNLIQVQRYSATAAGRRAAAVSAHHVRAVAMVGRSRRASRQPPAADDRSGDRRRRRGAVRAAGHRRLVLDDVLSGGGRARIRDGDHRRAADDDRDGCGRSPTRRRGVRHQQRGRARRGPAGDCRLRRRAGADVRCAREAAPRRPRLAAARAEIDRELPKMAGADLEPVSSIPPQERRSVRAIIDEGFVFAFRLSDCAAALAGAASAVGNGIRPELAARKREGTR